MEEDDKIRTLISCNVSYALHDNAASPEATGEAVATIDEENLAILPSFGETLLFPLRDIIAVEARDYKIELTLPGERLRLFDLGYQYEDFLRTLSRQRNEVLLKDMLMEETVREAGAHADYRISDENGRDLQAGLCEPRLYETALVLLPEKGDPFRIPYSDILQVAEADFALIVSRDSGEKIFLSAMGDRFAGFRKGLSQAMTDLSMKAQASLKELLPDVPPQFIRKLSVLMRDGRAAQRSDIDALSQDIWPALEKRLSFAGIGDEYDFLKSLSVRERICIGMKRGLLGDLTGDYIWFLMPIYEAGTGAPGNAIAMEAVSGEEGGRATYFFRITGRKEYGTIAKIDDLHREADNVLKQINRCMIEINFRREPIYLPEARLEDPRYARYHFSIRLLPSLRMLRELFIGRVVHFSFEQWKDDVAEILKLNVSTDDNATKFSKGR